ncbi:patatin-like phospholipase family protein [Algibacter mikhailovii]|uniref:patatin-like phospholipase family protein n=1 Tax=Algibacter mikhailovii TaxID=425498 RepID=UPI0024954E68|nr:patatin-like phospholipase family protein [Algibacter mikhailovii]
MKRKLAVLGFLISIFISSAQQDKKPKVALVLSGGGAKGVAHIPVLQKLDSLGIVPDLVVGTSMGSVIGGLYAAGYSGDEIEALTMKVNWDDVLGGTISLRDVGVEEKSEFNRYLVNLDVIEGKPRVKPALLKDQNLRELLSSLLYPVYDVHDFDKLPIPFRSVTTDLVNGKEVVIKDGSLSLAIRASMSIPSVFEPVPYKGTLLVDGGVLNNFPTDVAKELGADIIIGSDVGGGMQPIDKLNEITTILFQTSMMTSNLKNPENQKRCNILIDHYSNLTYSTQDFVKSPEIYQQGLIASQEKLSDLVALAETLKAFPKKPHELPKIEDAFIFHEIEYRDVSPENMSLLKARMNIKPNTYYTSKELAQSIDRAMGTEIFNQITYGAVVQGDRIKLVLTCFEKAKNQINGALHYDTRQGVGLIANYTGRNILGYSSRLLIGMDIAEQPKFRIEYQQNIGETKKWWWRGQIYGQKSKQSYYVYGNIGEELKSSFLKSNIQFNRDFNPLLQYFGVDINYEHNKTKPKLDPSVNNNIYDLRRYTSDNLEIGVHYAHNGMEKVFFPQKGTRFKGRISRSVIHHINVQYDEAINDNEAGSTNGFTKVSFEFEKRLPFKNMFSFIINAATGLTFIDKELSSKISFVENGKGAQYTLGGNLPVNRRDSYAFSGLGDSELIVTQFIKTHLGLQINAARNIYITPYASLASVGFDKIDSFFNGMGNADSKWIDTVDTSFLFSAGSTFSYHSILGPVNFDIAYVNHVSTIPLFFSVGLNLNIPN